MLGGLVANGVLREVRVQFHLIDCGQQSTAFDEKLQMMRLEVAHPPDCLGAARFRDLFECVPRAEESVVVLQRPVDEVEIDVVDAQLVDAGVESLQRRLVALIRIPQLRGEEDVLSRDGRVGDTSSDALFVSVGAAVSMCR